MGYFEKDHLMLKTAVDIFRPLVETWANFLPQHPVVLIVTLFYWRKIPIPCMMHIEWTNKIQYLHILHVLLKSSMREHTFFNVPFLDIFYYYFLFQQFTENKCSVQIVDDWIWTPDLWCRSQLLSQVMWHESTNQSA